MIRPKRPLFLVCILFLLLSLTVSIPKSPLDEEFDTEQMGSAIGKVEQIKRKEDKMTILLSEVLFQKEGEKTKYSLHKILIYTENKTVYPGNQILVKGILKKFLEPTNPGEFNSFYYYHSKEIQYGMMKSKVIILDARKDWLKVCLQAGRERMERVYNQYLLKEHAAVLSAMFLGDKSELSDDIKRLYQKNGMGHLLAISGLHISLIGMGVYQILLKLIKRKKGSVLIAMLCIVLYGIMTGFSISTNRAVVMMLLSFCSILIGRTYDMISAAALSAIIILALHPLEIKNAGFLLSFGAIIGISVVYPMFLQTLETISIPNGVKGIVSALLISFSIQIVTLPILLNNYYEYPMFGILINLIILPFLSLLAIFSVSAGILGMLWDKAAIFFSGGIYLILKLYEGIAKIFVKYPGANIVKGKPQSSFFVWYYLILVISLILWQLVRKKWAWLLLLLLFFIPVLPKNPGMKVTFLDVGQGDSIYIETKEGLRVLVDGGSSTKKKVGQYILEPFLKSQGCKKLDYVFLTHMDADHINGVIELMEFMKVGGVTIDTLVLGGGIEDEESYRNILKLVEENTINLKYIIRNQSLCNGLFSLHCIHPSGEKNNRDKNDNSIALEISYGEFSMVLTGDMEESEIEAMKYLQKKQYQILKVGHHGSNSSSSSTFLKRVNPQFSIISCGKRNRYGHPHMETIKRLKEENTTILYTKEGGAILVKTNGKKFVLDYF